MNTLKRKICILALLFGFIQLAWSQNIDISGNITDTNSKPIIGSVVQFLSDTIKIAQSTTTNKGNFKIQIASKQNQAQKNTLM